MMVEMTLEQKRKELQRYCDSRCDCDEDCIFNYEDAWCRLANPWKMNEYEVDTALAKLHPTNDIITKPSHYNREGAMECLDEIELIFGREALKYFCLCNAWKYRYRAADKNGEEDIKKSDEYLRRYKELCETDGNPLRLNNNLYPINNCSTGETTTTGAVI